jgi:hypothetical protein
MAHVTRNNVATNIMDAGTFRTSRATADEDGHYCFAVAL